eukprot:PhM_4_TR9436/c0_g1_i1/m.60440
MSDPLQPESALVEFLSSLGMPQSHAALLAQNGFENIENLRHATIDDLATVCRLPQGHARRIHAEVALLPKTETLERSTSPQSALVSTSSQPATPVIVEHYVCPICMELLVSPRTLPCGHTFCFHCLEYWVARTEKDPLCPIDRKPIPVALPDVNVMINERIEATYPSEFGRRAHAVQKLRDYRLTREFLFVYTRHVLNAIMVRNLHTESHNNSAPSEELERAMLRLPRGEFVPFVHREDVYQPQPMRITHMSFNVSAPTMHCFCIETLGVEPGDRVLDVGAGTGIVTALCAQFAGPTGVVHGIDLTREIVEFCRRNIDCQSFRAAQINEQIRVYSATHPYFLPGCMFTGTSCESASPSRLYKTTLIIDSRPSPTTFTGRLFTQTLANTQSYIRGDIRDGGKEVYIREVSVLHTRADRVPWIPCEYALKVSGKQLKGVYGHPNTSNPKATGRLSVDFAVNVWQSPTLDTISLYVGNVFDLVRDSARGTLTSLGGAYDKVHVGAACDPSRVDELATVLLKPGGTMVVPAESELLKIVKNATTGELHRTSMLPVRFGRLCDDEDESRPVVTPHPRGRLWRPEVFKFALVTAALDKVTHRSLCCGKPVICAGDVMVGIDQLWGEKSSLCPETTVLFAHRARLDVGVCVDVEADTAKLQGPLRINSLQGGVDVFIARCKDCRKALGVQFVSEPELRGSSDETYMHKFCFVSEFLREVGDNDDNDAEHPQEDVGEEEKEPCGNIIQCKSCAAPLAQCAQVLSTNHMWALTSQTGRYPAALLNTLLSTAGGEAVVERKQERDVDLTQGLMRCATLFCARCKAEVGWEFLDFVDTASAEELVWYVGRFGLVESCVRNMPPPTLAPMTSMNLNTLQSLLRQLVEVTGDENENENDGDEDENEENEHNL